MTAVRKRLARSLALAAAIACGTLSPAGPLDGQYFGRNKVQYRTFDFRVMQTPHFDIYYYPEEEAATRDAARMAERWYERLSRILDHRFTERQPLVLYGSHPAFQQTTTLRSGIGEGTGGVTEGFKQRVVMPLTGSYQETDHVLGHELVHAFQYDISGLGRSRGNISASARAFGEAPLWFTEGMAEYLSTGPVDPHTAMWLRDAVLSGNVPTIEQLSTDPRFFPYRWGHALWAYVGGRFGDATVGQILQAVGQGIRFDQAFERVLGVPLDRLSDDWHVAIRRAYLPLLAERPEAREVARPLITQRGEGGRLNLGPSVSPDGRYVAFLSELDFFDVELFLADAETGEVIRRLQKGTAFDPHFQSLRYINSAGGWAPDSRRFVFSALKGGQDVLVILDAVRGDVLREARVPGVIEIATPVWAPDGRTIVFSGISGGVSDLYAYDYETRETRRLTQDLFANLHPNVSPDGRTVAFVTDQGPGTDLGTLQYGGYRLALLDLGTGQTRVLPAPGEGSSINPVWNRDGSGLYFVSNRDGIPNVYRVEVASGRLFQLTRLFGGVSGITDISPAISAARSADRLLFTAYEKNGYNVYALNGADQLAGTPVAAVAGRVGEPPLPAVLPPVPRPQEAAFNRVATILADPRFGLAAPGAPAEWPVRPYRPTLTLDYLGQPQVGYATGGVTGQGGLYGGISALFSDVLGYHTLAGTVQASGQVDELGFSVFYLNQERRFNYGATAERIPYISLSQRVFFDEGQNLVRNQVLRFRTFNTALKGLTQYPLSPAQRVEFSGGYRRIAQDVQGIEVVGPPVIRNGEIVSFDPVERREFEPEGAEAAYNLAEASAALVYDNSLFGYTSPFAGQRYRFEVTPTAGSLSFLQALADYRRYLWLRPFALAFQGLHFGRYGADAEGSFYPLFLGQPSLVRGYYGLLGDCRADPQACDEDVVELLFGSRIGVAKAELRLPVLAQVRLGGGIPLPPIEGFAFADAGVAWAQDLSPAFGRGPQLDDGDRGFVTSAGVGLRINLLGYAIAEIDYVKPFEWDRGWHWQFSLQPGF
ncbi:MAG TPA: hypothetical protein VGR37_02300 [Longimicrobiaceae bacterium]|nr:hypothetical protein [Longimicrobiaceae bacterium]